MLKEARQAGEIGKEIETLQNFQRNFTPANQRIDLRWKDGTGKEHQLAAEPDASLRNALFDALVESIKSTVALRVSDLYCELRAIIKT